MTEPTYKAPSVRALLEELSTMAYGKSAVESIKMDTCIRCNKPANEFRDEASKKEFSITGLCQECQDIIWGVGDV